MIPIWHYAEKRLEKRVIRPGQAIPPRYAVEVAPVILDNLVDEFADNLVDEFADPLVG